MVFCIVPPLGSGGAGHRHVSADRSACLYIQSNPWERGQRRSPSTGDLWRVGQILWSALDMAGERQEQGQCLRGAPTQPAESAVSERRPFVRGVQPPGIPRFAADPGIVEIAPDHAISRRGGIYQALQFADRSDLGAVDYA